MIHFEYPEGATPIDPDEAQGLLLPHIRTRAELDRWEEENILEAEDVVFRRKQKDILTEKYACTLVGQVNFVVVRKILVLSGYTYLQHCVNCLTK